MGMYRLVLEATGGHGCQRDSEVGNAIYGCKSQTCPDCVVQEFVEKMMKLNPVSKAQLIHWPDTPSEIIDTFIAPTQEVKSYEASKYENGVEIKTGEMSNCISSTPIHRMRDKKF